MDKLVKELVASRVLKTPHIIEAFGVIDRGNFVLPEYKDMAYEDTALPIGESQTISQPYTVAFMLELLRPQQGNKIMDVGFGSGWQTALLAHTVSPNGKIFAIERIPELKKFGEENIAKYNFIKKGIVYCIETNAEQGIPQEAPFDRIISAASAKEVPATWKDQLAIGGRIVMPIGNSIWLLVKNKDGSFIEKEYPGFIFVPFVIK